MTSENLKYIIYEHSSTLSTFPELPKLLNKRFEKIIVRNIDDYKFNADDLMNAIFQARQKK